MLTLSHVGVSFGATVLFSDINLQVNAGERIALAGRNGAGKTTLLNIIAGLNAPTEGSVALAKGAEIGYLPQYMMLNDERTVREEARKAFSKELELKATVDRLTEEVATRTDYDTEEYMELIQQLANATELLSIYDTSRMEAEIEKTLKGLGFEQKDFDRPTREFSGGWRMRIELAKILLGRPDLLLLDEPTNHLDIASKGVLKEAIANYDGTVLIVSHDRDFLEGLVDKVIEFEDGKVLNHLGGMEEYLRKLHDRNTEINQSTAKEVEGEKKVSKGGGREDYEQQREQQRQISRLEKALAKAEETVDRLETEKTSLEDRLTIQATPDLLNQYEEVDYKLKKAMKEWEKCAEELAAYSD